MFLYHNIDFHTNNIGKKSIEIVKHMSFRCEREGMEGRYGESKMKCVCIVPHIRLYIFNEREIAREKAEGHSTMHRRPHST